MALHLEIVTPDRVVLRSEADLVSLPGVEGDLGILPGHTQLFAALRIGPMHFEWQGKTTYASISGGFAEIAEDNVRILADSAELADEIDVKRAEDARERAEERLKGKADINILRAEASLHRAIARLDVARFK